MLVLIACEFSGIVRDEFLKRGHDAWSCDILPSERAGPHIQGDALEAARSRNWDLMIAHPPCTFLSISGALHFKNRRPQQREALAFVRALMRMEHIPRIAIENPISIVSSRIRKSDQRIQPYQFGHREQKTTCLWLKGLPLLEPTRLVDAQGYSYVHQSLGSGKGKDRSRTYPGIARAMAEQWGSLPLPASLDTLADKV